MLIHLLAMIAVVSIAYLVFVYFWTFSLIRAFIYLDDLSHLKEFGVPITQQHKDAANKFAREYPRAFLRSQYLLKYSDFLLDNFNDSRRKFYRYACAEGYRP